MPHQGTVATVYVPSTAALVSSLKGAIPITNDLISQVNAVALSNPTLANLLGLAVSGNVTPEQLQTLSVTIQSLTENALKSTSSTSQPQSSASAPIPPSKSQSATPSQPPVPPPAFKSSQTTKPPSMSLSYVPQLSVLSLQPPQVLLPPT